MSHRAARGACRPKCATLLHAGFPDGSDGQPTILWALMPRAARKGTPPPSDGLFLRILPEERFHERAFRDLAGPEAMRVHEVGQRALGLVS